MFSWIKTKGARADQTRRAFRPGADRLESREVLSTLTFAPSKATRALPVVHPAASLHTLTTGMEATSLYGLQNTLVNAGKKATFVPGIVSRAIFSPTSLSLPASRVSTASTATTASTKTPTIPRIGGFENNASTNPAFLTTALNTARGLTTSLLTTSNASTTAASQFVNSLGLSGLPSQFLTTLPSSSATLSSTNTAGLGFTGQPGEFATTVPSTSVLNSLGLSSGLATSSTGLGTGSLTVSGSGVSFNM